MIIFAPRYFGLVAQCDNCGCLLGYRVEEVSSNSQIRCPQCQASIGIPFNPSYNGLVNESEGKQNG